MSFLYLGGNNQMKATFIGKENGVVEFEKMCIRDSEYNEDER